ncbi:MAG: polyprenyl synthetase family protein [Planctomycetaceae bacterium]
MAGCQVPSRPVPSPGPDESRSVEAALVRVRDFVEPHLDRVLAFSGEAAPRLAEAMRYAALAPGKRLRPALALWASQACGGSWEAAAPAAIAVELVHAYSLVHDDLPAMDDDDLRRGRPTCHRAFDEATAILCGDALQALAFETLARDMPAACAARACLVLARAAGAEALVGGQADDLAAERGWMPGLAAAAAAEQVAWMDRVNRRKTGAMFLAALELGGLAAGADAARLATLARFGRAFGQAFQIADDLLDAEGDEAAVGKRVGKDAGRGKLTFPTVEGVGAARARANRLAAEDAAAAGELGASADDLLRLATWIVGRTH